MTRPTILSLALAIVALLAVVGAGYFFAQQQTLLRQHAALEKELAVLKATDLAQRATFLEERVETLTKDLAAAREEGARLRERNATLEENVKKILPSFNAIDATQRAFFGSGDLVKSFPEISRAIDALGDPQITARWRDAEATLRADLADGSWSPAPMGEVLGLIIRRLGTLLPAE